MLQYIKKYIKGWLLGILLFFIFISFALWGIGDIFRQNTSYIVKVGKMKVSRDEFLIEYQFRMNEFNKNKNGFKDVSKNERIRIANQALNNLTNRYLFLNMAENMDIKISKDVLKKQIFNNEMFYKKDGKQEFDKNIYNNIVFQSFGSEERYLKYLESEMIINILSSHFSFMNNYPINLSKKIYDNINERKSFEIVSIDKIFEQKKIKKPDKKVIEDFFKKNEDLYFFNERRSFTYIYLDTEILRKEINIDDKEIEEIYNQRKEEFLIKEERDIQQIVFNNKNDADKAFEMLENGKSFLEVGKKITSQDLEIISLGLLKKDQLLSGFAEDVFSLENNQYTKPIKTDLGWHILKVTKIIKEKVKPIKLVKEEIKKELLLDKSYDEIDSIINELEDELSKGNSLEDIAKELNLKVYQKKLMESKDFLNEKNLPKIFSNKIFYKDIFEKKINDDNFIQELENSFFITRIDKIVPKTQKNFEEAYNDVFKKWAKKEAKKEVIKKVGKFKKKVEKNNFIKTSDELQFNSRITDLVVKDELIQQKLPKNFVEKLFNAKKGKILELDSDLIYYFVKVTSDKKNVFKENDYNNLKKNIEQEFSIDNLEQLLYVMKKKFPIKVNVKLFNSFVETVE